MKALRVGHYLNQFFAGVGGEDKAMVGPSHLEGSVGPGLLAQTLLGDRGTLVATIYCGDTYFGDNVESATEEVLSIVGELDLDLLLVGPAFNAGRYGIACGVLATKVPEVLGIPAVTGMYVENPGVDLFRKSSYIVATDNSAIGMKKALPTMIELGLKLSSGQEVVYPESEGCFSHGIKRNIVSDRMAAERAIDLLLAKLRGHEYASEIALAGEQDIVPVATPIPSLRDATIAVVTEGGLVPRTNPDRLESSRATRWAKYLVSDLEKSGANGYQSIHRGFDTSFVNEDPNRLVPIDALREMEQEGVFKALFPHFFVTTGVATAIDNARRIGRGMAEELLASGVSGVILTST